jgi:hypothetical protein
MVIQKEEVLKSFQVLLAEYEKSKLRVATKDELVSKAKNKDVVQTASGYTADNILKGLTDLQLHFSDTIGKWTQTLQTEAKKQEELQKAIAIETQRLKELQNVKTAAGALYLLKQEHQAKIDALQTMDKERNVNLEENIAKETMQRGKEQEEFEQILLEFTTRQTKERLRENEEFAYNFAKIQQTEKDLFEETQKMTEREATKIKLQKTKNWNERENILEKQKAAYETNRKKLDEFPSKLEEETKKERKDAAEEATREAKNKAELLEKEENANKQIAEQRIASLEKNIAFYDAELLKLTEQLHEASKKVQDLSLKALENNKK